MSLYFPTYGISPLSVDEPVRIWKTIPSPSKTCRNGTDWNATSSQFLTPCPCLDLLFPSIGQHFKYAQHCSVHRSFYAYVQRSKIDHQQACNQGVGNRVIVPLKFAQTSYVFECNNNYNRFALPPKIVIKL